MHVLQYIAVKAESPEEAIAQVEEKLQDILGNEYGGGAWYDWFVTGGGRFNQDSEPYTSGQTNMVVSSKNSEAFELILHDCVEARMSEFRSYRASWGNANINLDSYFDEFDGNIDYGMPLYPLGKMIEIVQGEWDFNSYFYDLDNWSTNPVHMNKERLEVGTLWYLVPVDFHY